MKILFIYQGHLPHDLQELLGYAKWDNFAKVIGKALIILTNSRNPPPNSFIDKDLVENEEKVIEPLALKNYIEETCQNIPFST